MRKVPQLLLLAFALSGVAQAVTYTMKELPGLPGGGTGRGAVAINEKGRIAGTMRDAQGNERAVVWDEKGTIRDLGTLPGHCISWAADMNGAGQVVGWSSEAQNRNKHAVLWEKDGKIVDLGMLGGWLSEANAINNKGHVVGYFILKDKGAHAFLWKPETGMSDLGVLEGCTHSSADDINDAGRIVGHCSGSCSDLHAVMWEVGGTIKDLNPILNMGASNATAINSSGQIAGKVGWMCGKGNAFLWDAKEGLRDLGRLLKLPKTTALINRPPVPGSDATALNDHGQVVGWSHDERAHSHAFFWSLDSGMIDLGAMKDERFKAKIEAMFPKGFVPVAGFDDEGSSSAADINNAGAIVGCSNGHAVIWEPTP